ncbi:MAG TPA: BolA family protein [Vitreimonas sp.]|uniref:BolA family protein n=1 Tax=Vitreimonas sp. TaxID=3069702 RepID=UPI002D38D53A|nr:BolA family protein [Vitreimonas sp.]HYD88688.1 BolA family protein [Vitreimonas sp.]
MTDTKTHLSRAERIEKLLKPQLSPHVFVLEDESARHIGHAGARPEGETHYRLRVVSDAFAGLSRVARQRLVYDALREEFDTGLHALSLDLKTSAEA